jgi:DNA (cytosine-5)-methyltransferase 1
MLKVLDLFSGIGGFSIGLERTGGFKTVAFCEIEPYPRKVLAKHWPEVHCYHDVRELTADRLTADGIAVDVICGGFPCQDISVAGNGAGLAGERSGLWSEFARLIGELRPRYAIVENVSALLGRGLADVLGDLAALGYDAEWHCIPASAVGAPHRRDRIWIIAYANRSEWREDLAPCRSVQRENGLPQGQEGSGGFSSNSQVVADTNDQRQLQSQGRERSEWRWIGDGSEKVADANSERLQRRLFRQKPSFEASQSVAGRSKALAYAEGEGLDEQEPTWDSRPDGLPSEYVGDAIASWWLVEPDVGRVANGIPSRVDRLKGLGNAVVPQIPELIGRAILAAVT